MESRGHAVADELRPAFEMYPSVTRLNSRPRTSYHSGGRTLHAHGAAHTLETILVATDFSPRAAHAVERAVILADELPISKATLLHVVRESPFSAVRRLLVPTTNQEHIAPRLQRLANDVRRRTGLLVDERVESGDVVRTTQKLASEADLTILGAPCGHPLRDLVLGSTAQRLLRHVRRPLLVVRRPAGESYQRVLVAVDLSTDAANAMAYAQMLAPRAEISLVHAYRAPYEGKMQHAAVAEELIRKYRTEAKVAAASAMVELVASHRLSPNVRALLLHGYAVPTLLEKEREVGADLIVVTKREQSLATDRLLESVTLALLARSRCDVLVVRMPA